MLTDSIEKIQNYRFIRIKLSVSSMKWWMVKVFCKYSVIWMAGMTAGRSMQVIRLHTKCEKRYGICLQIELSGGSSLAYRVFQNERFGCDSALTKYF